MSSTVIIWLTPLPPYVINFTTYRIFFYVVLSLFGIPPTPYVIICHLANPPAPQNDDVICKQPLIYVEKTISNDEGAEGHECLRGWKCKRMVKNIFGPYRRVQNRDHLYAIPDHLEFWD